MFKIDKDDELYSLINDYNKCINNIINDIEDLRIDTHKNLDVIDLQNLEEKISKINIKRNKIQNKFLKIYNLYTTYLSDYVYTLKEKGEVK